MKKYTIQQRAREKETELERYLQQIEKVERDTNTIKVRYSTGN